MREFVSAHPGVQQRPDDQFVFVCHRRRLFDQRISLEVFQGFTFPARHFETAS